MNVAMDAELDFRIASIAYHKSVTHNNNNKTRQSHSFAHSTSFS